MVAFLNLLLPALMVLILLVTWYLAGRSNSKTLVWTTGGLLAAAVAVVYATAQPSYIPKSSVPPMSRVPLEENKNAPVQTAA